MTTTETIIEKKSKKKRKKTQTVQQIFKWALGALTKAADRYYRSKYEIILETASRLEEIGIEPNKISSEICKGLKDIVDDRYVREVLADYPQYKNETKVKGGKNARKNRASSAQTEQSKTEEQSQEEEQQEGPEPSKHPMTTTEGRMGYVNEEHECYKDKTIKSLEESIKSLEAQVERTGQELWKLQGKKDKHK